MSRKVREGGQCKNEGGGIRQLRACLLVNLLVVAFNGVADAGAGDGKQESVNPALACSKQREGREAALHIGLKRLLTIPPCTAPQARALRKDAMHLLLHRRKFLRQEAQALVSFLFSFRPFSF